MTAEICLSLILTMKTGCIIWTTGGIFYPNLHICYATQYLDTHKLAMYLMTMTSSIHLTGQLMTAMTKKNILNTEKSLMPYSANYPQQKIKPLITALHLSNVKILITKDLTK